jgi:hypothetical protein
VRGARALKNSSQFMGDDGALCMYTMSASICTEGVAMAATTV